MKETVVVLKHLLASHHHSLVLTTYIAPLTINSHNTTVDTTTTHQTQHLRQVHLTHTHLLTVYQATTYRENSTSLFRPHIVSLFPGLSA